MVLGINSSQQGGNRMVLTRTGFYNEMPHAESSDPSIKDNIGMQMANKDHICRYLRNGIVLAACGEVVTDVLHPENGVIGTPDDVTDGKWIWPAELVYYVEKYDLKLDDAFVDYMMKNNWTISDSIEIDYDNIEVQ